MGERFDEFREKLRNKLTGLDNDMKSLKAKMDDKTRTAEQDVRSRLDVFKKHADQERAKVTAAQNEMKKWAEERKAATSEKLAEWKTKRDMAKLQSRANSAVHYAEAAAVVAFAAVDEAVQAALEAWLAQKDASNVQGAKAA